MPRDQEPPEHLRLDRLHLLPQPRQRAPPQAPQDLRVAPLAAVAAGPELAFDHAPGIGEALQRGLDHCRTQSQARRHVRRRERAVGAGVAPHQVRHGVGRFLEQRLGQALRQRRAQRIAIACRIFDGDEPFLAGHAHAQDAPLGEELGDGRLREVRCRARAQLLARQVAQPQQQIVHGVGRTRVEPLRQALQRRVRSPPAPRCPRGRAARLRRSAHAAATDRPTAPGPAVRPAARHRRTGSWRRSRRGATPRTATACGPPPWSRGWHGCGYASADPRVRAGRRCPAGTRDRSRG